MIRLLIADDSALMRKLLEGIFREEGDFDIRLARNGAEALELVRSFDPAVVTLDVQMPGMPSLRTSSASCRTRFASLRYLRRLCGWIRLAAPVVTTELD